MGVIGVLLLVVSVLSAVILVIVVLLQDEEGEGMGGLFSGASSTPFGSRSGNVLTRFTTVVAAVFLIGTFSLAWINRTPESGNIVGKARMESLKDTQEDWWIEVEPTELQPEEQEEVEVQPAQEGSLESETEIGTESEETADSQQP